MEAVGAERCGGGEKEFHVEFLASENAGFITGSTLSLNGGQHMY